MACRLTSRQGLSTRTVTSPSGNRPRRVGRSTVDARSTSPGRNEAVTLRRSAARLGHSASVTVSFTRRRPRLATAQLSVASSPSVIASGSERPTEISDGDWQAAASTISTTSSAASTSQNAVQLLPGQANSASPHPAASAANHTDGTG